ncbi:DUF2283 domain-containing protein [bacterium]|nr:DUF2283 domain-containing protein [bacterium]
MKGIYDRETDTLTLILREARIEESDEVRPGIIFDYDADGAVVSVEILDASRNVSEPLSFAYEVKEQAVAG